MLTVKSIYQRNRQAIFSKQRPIIVFAKSKEEMVEPFCENVCVYNYFYATKNRQQRTTEKDPTQDPTTAQQRTQQASSQSFSPVRSTLWYDRYKQAIGHHLWIKKPRATYQHYISH